jgi:alkanesulfonate monooxygenase SsuD/methylene tetrahydromethanopterin reductase-like flavin-dependent oxidoreductase (luciferase family)
MAPYGDDEELRYVESNAVRSYVEGLINHAPDINGGKWTKRTLAEHIMVGGLGATCVGTPEVVADEMERWVEEGGVDGFNIVREVLLMLVVVRDTDHTGVRNHATNFHGRYRPPHT